MAPTTVGEKTPTIGRILREAAEMSKNPSSDYTANPLESDLHEWHFTLRGPPNSAYAEGIYHGRIVLPPTYPLRPPSFRFVTPSGRFEVNREICLSISSHHEDTWQPAWGVRTALVALRSFMETDPKGQLGGLDTPESVRQRLALESRLFRCPACGKMNLEIIQNCEELCKATDEAQNVDNFNKARGEDTNTVPTAPEAEQPAGADGEDSDLSGMVEGLLQSVQDGPPPPPFAPLGPTRTIPPAVSPAHPLAAAPPPVLGDRLTGHVSYNNGVPVWLDRMIAALILLLVGRMLQLFFA